MSKESKDSIKSIEHDSPMVFKSIQELPIDSEPHVFLRYLGINEDLVLWDAVQTPSGEFREFQRRLSIKERISCLKAAAPYYAPQLRSIDGMIRSDLAALSEDELKAKLKTYLSDKP